MSTIIHPDAAPPRWFYKNLARVLVEPAASEGTLGIVEMLGTRGEMPPLHVHHREDEAFVVLGGELSIHLPNGSSALRAGEALVAPRGISHTYRVETERARWLAVSTPAGFVSFVEAASDPADYADVPPDERPVDMDRLLAQAEAHGIEIIGPPGTMP